MLGYDEPRLLSARPRAGLTGLPSVVSEAFRLVRYWIMAHSLARRRYHYRYGVRSVTIPPEEYLMDIRKKRVRTVGIALMVAAFAVVSAPASVQAQDAPLLTRFAKVHLQINVIRDEYQGRLARIHDVQGRALVRAELDAKIAEVYEAEGMTSEEYDRITLAVSLDSELREEFEALLEELSTNEED